MSLTSRERHNPPPRRKSCNACIKAKRRCDTGLPTCLRCEQRRIPCVYQARPRAARLQQGPSEMDPLPESTPLQFELESALLDKDFVPISLPLAPVDDSLDAMTMLMPDPEHPLIDLSPFLNLDAPSPMELIHQTSLLDTRGETRDGLVAEVIATRMQYAIDQIKGAVNSMVLENRTPWCHSQLYADGMPRPMQDAHACCALYMAKNPVNSTVILRSIESRVQDLFSAPEPSTAREVLAKVHALLIYQIIRLFDGDIAARAAAERTIPDLEEVAMDLLAYIRFDTTDAAPECEIALFPLAPVKSFWKDWLFQESARRTLLMTLYFIQTYRLVSGQRELMVCDGKLGLCHSWTLSAHLWQANTPLEFAQAWRDKKHYVITDAQFGLVLQEARADDVDVFGKIFISSLLGIEEAQGWFASRGGEL